MKRIDLLLEQYKISQENYKFCRENKINKLSIFTTVVIALITIIIDNNLPNFMFLIASFLIISILIFNNTITQRQLTYRGICFLTEKKINKHYKKKIITIFEDYNQLNKGIDSNQTRLHRNLKKIYNFIFFILFITIFEITFYIGIKDIKMINTFLLHIVTYILIIVVNLIQYYQYLNIRKNLTTKLDKLLKK